MPEFRVIMKPPDGEPQTYEAREVADDGTESSIELPQRRDITLSIASEDAARRYCERQAEAVAAQEVAGQFPDDPDSASEAAAAKTWVIESITAAGAEAASAEE